MSNTITIITCKALTRIGIFKARQDHAGFPTRRNGDVFDIVLNSDHNKVYFNWLKRHGAIKVIDKHIINEQEAETVMESLTPKPSPFYTPEINEEDIEVEPEVEEDFLEFPEYELSSPITDLHFLNEDQIDILRRIDIVTLEDFPKRQESEIKSLRSMNSDAYSTLKRCYEEVKEVAERNENG